MKTAKHHQCGNLGVPIMKTQYISATTDRNQSIRLQSAARMLEMVKDVAWRRLERLKGYGGGTPSCRGWKARTGDGGRGFPLAVARRLAIK